MKEISKLTEISAKKSFKLLREKWSYFCTELNSEIFITNLFFRHISWSSKKRKTKEKIKRLLIIPLVDEILEKWKLTETRNLEWDIFYKIFLEIKDMDFFLIILEKKWKNKRLLSSFVNQKKAKIN